MLPSALLPRPVPDGGHRRPFGPGTPAGWQRTARAVISVAPDGRLERIEMPRWDAEGLDGKPGYVLWVGDQLTEERRSAAIPSRCAFAPPGGPTRPRQIRSSRRKSSPYSISDLHAQPCCRLIAGRQLRRSSSRMAIGVG